MPDGIENGAAPGEITAEVIEAAAARDVRIRAAQKGINLSAELDRSPAMKIVMEAATQAAGQALEALVHVNPADTSEIVRLQAIVFRHRYAANLWQNVIEAGEHAEASLMQEAQFQ